MEAMQNSPRLSLEIFDQILGYSTTQDLLTWRTVSSDWNELIASRHLPHSQHAVSLSRGRDLDAFVTLMGTRIKDTTFPFSAFKICIRHLDYIENGIRRFTEAVGPHALTYKIRLCTESRRRNGYLVSKLLNGAPQLENLQIKFECMTMAGSLKFPTILSKLKILTILPIRNIGPINVDLSYVRAWLAKTPVLEELDCQLLIEDAEFESVFMKILTQPNFKKQLHIWLSESTTNGRFFQKVTLVDPKTRETKIQGDDWTLISKWLGTTLPNLKKLTLLGEVGVPTFVLPTLETMHLAIVSETGDLIRDSILASKLPALRTIILEDVYRPSDLLGGKSFPMVEHLQFRGQIGDYLQGNQGLNRSFPNLTSLHLLMDSGVDQWLMADECEFITTHYPNLIHLSLYEFSENDEATYYPLLSGQLNTSSLNKSFATFKDLKTLEIGGRYKGGVLLAISTLTRAKKMPKLDYLGIYPCSSCDSADDSELESDLEFCTVMVDSLLTLNWHKEISMDVKRSPHYRLDKDVWN